MLGLAFRRGAVVEGGETQENARMVLAAVG